MIHCVKASNFFSFEDEVIIDFTVNDKAPNNDGYVLASNNQRLSLVEAVIGPNASGKTNALRVISFLKWLLVDSYKDDVAYLPLDKFAGSNDKKLPAILTAVFDVNGEVYTYEAAVSAARILSERLSKRTLTKSRVTTKNLYSRTWDSKNKQYLLKDKAFDLPENFNDYAQLANASLIGASKRLGHKLSGDILNFWANVTGNVNIRDKYIAYPYESIRAWRYYKENIDQKVNIEEALRHYDIGFDRFNDDGDVVHTFGNRTFTLPIFEESSGTQQLLVLRRYIDEALNKGGVVVIDEFDSYLHPTIVRHLVGLFLDPRINKGKAQILLSTHSHHLLNLLDKYQIIIADKNRNGGSELFRLDEVEGVRSDDNYFAKYMAGEYGGVPNVS